MSSQNENAATGNILVVDDNEDNLDVLSRRLNRKGYCVTAANSGEKALGQIAQSQEEFDLLLLDVMMPGIDGFEVLRRLRTTYSPTELPIILVTAKDQSEDIITGLKLGANDYVTKPIDFPVMFARVRNNVGLAESHRALKSAQKFLVDAAKMESISYLAAGVAHEIRNPLAQIQMGVDYIKMVVGDDEDAQDVNTILETMEQAVDSADKIIKNLMQFSKRRRMEHKKANVSDLVDTCLSFLSRQIETGKIDVSHEREETCTAEVDVSQLETALLNVLTNALQAMPDGGSIHVSTHCETLKPDQVYFDEGTRSGNVLRIGDRVVVVSISDSGGGIAEEKLSTIFEAFYTSQATGKGTGLGLTVAKKIVDLHGGLIKVANRADGSGAVVTFVLPSKAQLSTSV